jgi:hypothetical protein
MAFEEDDEKLVELIGMLGVDTEIAQNLLDAAGGNVNEAVSLYYDEYQGKTEGSSLAGEEQIRAPIAPKRTIMQEDAGDYGNDYNNITGGNSGIRFYLPEPFADNARLNPQNETAVRLAQLYKPPTELVHQPPTFEAARATARQNQIPLIVSLYDPTIFQCHIENRDIWSNPVMRDFIKDGTAIFLQLPISPTSGNAGQGETYASRYRVQAPHIGIIDPRTGELLKSYSTDAAKLNIEDFLAELINFQEPLAETEKFLEEEEESQEFEYNEPEAGPDVTTIMFRLPDGKRIPKRFNHSDPLSLLYKVAHSLVPPGKLNLRFMHETLDESSSMSLKDKHLLNALIIIVQINR